MTDILWDDVRKAHLQRLDDASKLLDRVQVLCDRAPNEIGQEVSATVADLRPRVKRQLQKLVEDRFEVAVLGLEKAGKSAVLNAWLGVEILPSVKERCTYTTTEIWSAPSEEEQEVHVEYFTHDQMKRVLSDKEARLADLARLPHYATDRNWRDLNEDVRETTSLQSDISGFIDRRQDRQSFREISEVADLLQSVVYKNHARARAARRVVLRTTRLLKADRNIVFHDVPGFDSPVTLHQEQAIARIRECDAVLYAKRADQPTTTGPEESMLAVADDDHVKIGEKLFLALTRIDSARTPREHRDNMESAKSKWATVPASRIVGVCPPAYLARHGTGTPETNEYGAVSITYLKAIEANDGIDDLKKAVGLYIDHDRARVLEKRCLALESDALGCARKVLTKLAPAYPEDVGELDSRAADAAKARLRSWWGQEWAVIAERFQNWYYREMLVRPGPDAKAAVHPQFEQLRKNYETSVASVLDGLPTASHDAMETVFIAANRTRGLSVSEAHVEVRKKIHEEAVAAVDNISLSLAPCLEALLDLFATQAKKELWSLPDVESNLIPNRATRSENIYHGLNALFLRFGRVAVDVFLAYPRHDRDKILEKCQTEVATLGHFYRGPESKARENLESYLRLGKFVVQGAEAIGKVPPGTTEAVKRAGSILDGKQNPHAGPLEGRADGGASTFKEVEKEIREDLKMLQDYLLYSVYFAAGFVEYCEQELERLRKRFISLEEKDRRWMTIVETAVERRHHAPGLFQLEDEERGLRIQREIAIDLQDLRKLAATLA